MSASEPRFVRAVNAIADLDNPFYAEERQRDVWNEASAVGFQALLWCMFGLVAAMVWIGGRPLFGWATVLMLAASLSSALVLIHAGRLGVTGFEGSHLPWPRLILAVLLIGVIGLGVLVRTDFGASPSGIAGAVVGLVAAVAGTVGAVWVIRRRAEATGPGADDPDDVVES